MSGGVDSSVAAALLKERGFDVVGAHLKCYNVDGCAEQDAEDARRAAEVLGIPFYVFDMEQEYKDKVVEYMVDGYRKGLTPNPDVMCNKEIKFGLFLQKALEMGADYVATGHYVRLGRSRSVESSARTAVHSLQRRVPATPQRQNSAFSGNQSFGASVVSPRQFGRLTQNIFSLYIAKDKNKDQSYFLWTLTQEQLRHCLFPIGEYTKPEVRKLAKKFGLPNAEKKDSQGICFLGQVTLKDFLGNYIPEKMGLVLNSAGETVGKHSGAYFYTIGQRRIGVNLQPTTNNQQPFYVASKDVKTNTVVIASEDDPMLYKKEIELRDVNLVNMELSLPPGRAGGRGIKNKELSVPVLARVRYRQPLVPASFVIHNSLFKLVFSQPQKFVASGQSAVFYLPADLSAEALAKAEASAKEGSNSIMMLGGGVIV